MQLSHTRPVSGAVFDDPNLVSSAGLVPILALARAAGLHDLAAERLSVPTDRGANAGLKVASLVAGMVAGADCIDDMALLRHGGMAQQWSMLDEPEAVAFEIAVSRTGNRPVPEAEAFNALGEICRKEGGLKEAIRRHQEALVLAEAGAYRVIHADALLSLAAASPRGPRRTQPRP